MFLFKKKKVVLNCYTYRPDVYSYFPIEKSSKHIPEWWKNLPNQIYLTEDTFMQAPTMKSCVGFVNYYNCAIAIPMWSDCKIITNTQKNEINWLFSDQATIAMSHHHGQKGEYLLNSESSYAHMKIDTPWLFQCEEEVNFLFSGNTWSLDTPEKIIIPPGIINYKYQNATNINMFIKMDNTISLLNAGIPYVHVFPMTEREIEIKTHFVDYQQYMAIYSTGVTNFFNKSYYKHKKIMQDKEKLSKCPVSHLFRR